MPGCKDYEDMRSLSLPGLFTTVGKAQSSNASSKVNSPSRGEAPSVKKPREVLDVEPHVKEDIWIPRK